MILINKTFGNKSFFQFSEEHWETINPYSANLKRYYIKESLIGRIETKMEEHRIHGRNAQSNFYSILLSENYNLLKRIILTHIDNFPDLIIEVETILKNNGLHPLNNAIKFGEELDTVFNYENWRTNGKGADFFREMGLEVCPYCNIENMYEEKEREIVVASFDHFYDQSTYPYLSLSFYNVIPVCKICNETHKGSTKFTVGNYCHPYSDDYNLNVQFESDYFKECPDYKISIKHKTNINNRFSNFTNALSFKTSYNVNNIKKYAKLLYIRSQEYDETKKATILTEYPGLTKTEVEKGICEIIDVPYANSEILNHQFGKLKRDLSKNYKIITTL